MAPKVGMNRRIPKMFAAIIIALLSIIVILMCSHAKEFKVGDDEIALYIQLDTNEDIGLLVFDYSANGAEFSGGTSNADKSLIKHDERLIEVLSRESLNCFADSLELYIQFRIITEYTVPNYENIYSESVTKYIEPISFEAHFGESYYFTIIGDNISGYTIVQNHAMTNKMRRNTAGGFINADEWIEIYHIVRNYAQGGQVWMYLKKNYVIPRWH